jgi:tetratricopeptide (TPR) repeat protein
VSKLSAVNEYGKGLDARDRGDLDAASKHLQKVVTSEPSFALGKSRYGEIMKALYKAKDRREDLLSKTEADLLAHAEAVFAKHRPTDAIHVAYRVVRGQYFLERVRKAVEKGEARSAWQKDLRAYFQEQQTLIGETGNLATYSRQTLGHFSTADEKLAEDLGIRSPGSTFFIDTPAEMMRESANIIMVADASNHYSDLGASLAMKMPCPFTLDPSFGLEAIRWYEAALVHIAKYDRRYGERETMRTLRELARALALLGRTEEGIARLQAGLDAHPKSDEFESTEKLLRELLEAPPRPWCKLK